MDDEKILSEEKIDGDDATEESIRPELLSEYIGQKDVKENIKVFIEAAKMRGETLDHVLLYGPPGLGKTTLAYIIANEMGTSIKTASGPSIEKSGDLAAILSSLEPGDVLFIDEIHRMPSYIEEILYPAMEDFTLDIIVGGDGNSKNIKIKDDFDKGSPPINPIKIQDKVNGNDKNANVLFFIFFCIISALLEVKAAPNCNAANINPKYCSGTFISLNILLLKFTIPNIIPIIIALNKINDLILFDFSENLNASFICSLYSLKVDVSTFSSTIVVFLNLKEITVDIMQQEKHNIIGIYPFITKVIPATTEETASNK